MKTLKKLFYLLTLVGLVGLVSCEDDPTYTPAELQGDDNAQVYFDADAQTEVAVKLNSGDITIPVKRQNVAEPFVTSVELTFEKEESKAIFSLDNDVVAFNPGDTVVNLVLKVNYEEIEYDKAYKMALAISDPNNVYDYGVATYNFTVTCPAPWKYLGVGQWNDDLLSGLYGPSLAGIAWEVDVYESDLEPGLIRVKNVYKADQGIFAMVNFSDLLPAPDGRFVDFDCRDAADAKLPFQPTGLVLNAPGWGELWIGQLRDSKGTLENGIITFTQKTLFIGTGDMHGTFGNANGLFALYLPGAEVPVVAPAVEVEYQGVFKDAAKNVSAVLNYEMNETAVKYRSIVLEGGIRSHAAEAEKIYQALLQDNWADETAKLNGDESGEQYFVLPKTGVYSVFAMPFNEAGEPGDWFYTQFEYAENAKAAPVPVKAPADVYVGGYMAMAESALAKGSYAPWRVDIKPFEDPTYQAEGWYKLMNPMPIELLAAFGKNPAGFIPLWYGKTPQMMTYTSGPVKVSETGNLTPMIWKDLGEMLGMSGTDFMVFLTNYVKVNGQYLQSANNPENPQDVIYLSFCEDGLIHGIGMDADGFPEYEASDCLMLEIWECDNDPIWGPWQGYNYAVIGDITDIRLVPVADSPAITSLGAQSASSKLSKTVAPTLNVEAQTMDVVR